MKKLKLLEAASESGMTFAEMNINRTFYWAYKNSLETGNETLDFSEVIWDTDIAPIVEACRAYEIDSITISSTFSGLIPTLAAFEALGCKMAGLTTVKGLYTDWTTGARAMLPAIVVRI